MVRVGTAEPGGWGGYGRTGLLGSVRRSREGGVIQYWLVQCVYNSETFYDKLLHTAVADPGGWGYG